MVKKLTNTKKEMFYGSCIDNSHTGHIDSHRVGGGGGMKDGFVRYPVPRILLLLQHFTPPAL